jgi:hypothetical protein
LPIFFLFPGNVESSLKELKRERRRRIKGVG